MAEAHHALIEVRNGEESRAGLTPLFARQTALGSGTNRQGGRLRRASWLQRVRLYVASRRRRSWSDPGLQRLPER